MEELSQKAIIENLRRISTEDCYSSFRIVYDHYYNRLFHQAMYYFNHQDTAQEIVSDIFISLWQSRKVLHKITDPDSYLFISLKYARAKYIEKMCKENKEIFTEILPDILQPNIFHDDSNPENKLVESELEEKYQISLAKLPPRCAEVFRLVRQEKKKYSEVAEILSISTKTVDNQMNKAVKMLYSELKEHLFIAF